MIILFDLGGTLVESPDLFRALARNMCVGRTSEEIERIRQDIKRRFEKEYFSGNFKNVKNILKKICRTVAQEFSLKHKIRPEKIYKEIFINRSRLYPGVRGLLQRLKEQRVSLFAATDADVEVVRRELKVLGIITYFEKLFISENIKHYKWHRRFADVVRASIPKGHSILVIGDSDADKTFAKNIAAEFIRVDPGRDKIYEIKKRLKEKGVV